ncbi:MAG: hypothetical protein LBT36_03285 [Oscillospiraceae bacterium]|nr:hypothetical protein [Oscillospiraceae bacterium]
MRYLYSAIANQITDEGGRAELTDELAARYAKKIPGFAYGKTRGARAAEEIARELCVATAYIEPHLAQPVYMDHLTEKGGKYHANFPILTWRDHVVGGLHAWNKTATSPACPRWCGRRGGGCVNREAGGGRQKKERGLRLSLLSASAAISSCVVS